MKTIKVIVTKETIRDTDYGKVHDCAICKTLRALGYEITSAGGWYVRSGDQTFDFLNGTNNDLTHAFINKYAKLPYGDVICELQEPPKASQHPAPKATEVVERIVYVMVDSTVKELSGQLTNN